MECRKSLKYDWIYFHIKIIIKNDKFKVKKISVFQASLNSNDILLSSSYLNLIADNLC
jgi:hypothetical protein